MADRVSATITIGGCLSPARLPAFAAAIEAQGLSTDWDGEPFNLSELPKEGSLRLVAHEVAWGRFDDLEAFCEREALPYIRWSGGYVSQWGPERVVFTGTGDPTSYPCDEDDTVVIDRERIDRLGTLEAVLAWFDAAAFEVPPLRV